VAPSVGDYVLPLEERKELQRYDPDEARRLLAEAGFPDGFSTTMLMTNGYGEQYVRQSQWIVEDLSKVGIDVTLDLVEYGTYFGSRWPNVDYDMQHGPQSALLEADEWLRAQHRTGAGRNWWNVSDPKLDAMLDEQTRILDREERIEAVQDIQRYILTDVVNPVQTWSTPNRSPRQPWVHGWYPQFVYGYFTMKQTWLDR
jgi:peptide/nickel transport system substrate-binding protein